MPVYKIEISKCSTIEKIERSNGQISEYQKIFKYRNIRMQGAKFARHTTGFPREKAAQLGQGSREVDIQEMFKRKYLRCSKENIQDAQKKIFKAWERLMFKIFKFSYKNKTKGPRQVRELVLLRSQIFGEWMRKKYYLKASFG